MLNNDAFNQILRGYGYPVDNGSLEYERELDVETLERRIPIDLQVSQKTPMADDYWYGTDGIPKSNYDEQLN